MESLKASLQMEICLLYTSDAADELDGVDLGGRRIIKTDLTLEVSGLSLNTKTLNKGYVFVALQGEKNHGVEFIEDAIEKGCIAAVSYTHLTLPTN